MRIRLAAALLVPAAALGALAAPEEPPPRHAELILRLDTEASAPGGLAASRPLQPRVAVVSKRPVSRAVHQRDPTLSEEHLLVIVLDPGRRELARTIVTDPRLVRAETTDADGRLLSAGLWRMVGSLRIVVPDDAAAYVDVYQPRWTGRRMALDLLGSAPVP